MKNATEEIISKLALQPHPEGGYYRETYRSQGSIQQASLAGKYKGERNYATCIYFLLKSETFSAFHRIKQDEIWHFYDGSPIRMHMISAAGSYSIHFIGRDFNNGELPQFVVPGGCWFAAEVIHKNNYSLVGCTVSPGFSFEDFELIPRKNLISFFPEHEEIICRLTHE